MGVRVRRAQGSVWRGGLGGLPPLSVAVCRGHVQYLALLLTPGLLLTLKKWQLVFAVFVSCCPQFTPTTRVCAVLFCFGLIPYSVFVFCWSRRHLSRCKNCSKVPGSQPVSSSLYISHLWEPPRGHRPPVPATPHRSAAREEHSSPPNTSSVEALFHVTLSLP